MRYAPLLLNESVHAADAAMYAVKQSGKGGFVISQSSDAMVEFPQKLMLEHEAELGDDDASVQIRTEHSAITEIDDGLCRDPIITLIDCGDALWAREQIAWGSRQNVLQNQCKKN